MFSIGLLRYAEVEDEGSGDLNKPGDLNKHCDVATYQAHSTIDAQSEWIAWLELMPVRGAVSMFRGRKSS
jgi:hypothetical protein